MKGYFNEFKGVSPCGKWYIKRINTRIAIKLTERHRYFSNLYFTNSNHFLSDLFCRNTGKRLKGRIGPESYMLESLAIDEDIIFVPEWNLRKVIEQNFLNIRINLTTFFNIDLSSPCFEERIERRIFVTTSIGPFRRSLC